MATLSRIAVHPIKALEPVEPDEISITDAGGLVGDREYALVDDDGAFVNGKRTAKVHDLSTEVDLDANTVTVRRRGGERRQFHLDRNRDALADWCSDHFGIEVDVQRAAGGEQTDGSGAGPTLISRATLREIASWFPGIDAEGMRLRLRPNLVVEGVAPFREDRFVGGRLRIGEVELEGVKHVPRCVVPTRDPHTGDVYEGFRKTFVRRREETLPEWTDPSDLDHFYTAMIATRIPPESRDGTLSVGDPVEAVIDQRV